MFSQSAGQAKSQMLMVKLKNGSKVPLFMASIIKGKLDDLFEENLICFYDLVMKCRNPEHKINEKISERLEQLALMCGGEVNEMTRNIVLSAVGDEGFTLSSPLGEGPSNKLTK